MPERTTELEEAKAAREQAESELRDAKKTRPEVTKVVRSLKKLREDDPLAALFAESLKSNRKGKPNHGR